MKSSKDDILKTMQELEKKLDDELNSLKKQTENIASDISTVEIEKYLEEVEQQNNKIVEEKRKRKEFKKKKISKIVSNILNLKQMKKLIGIIIIIAIGYGVYHFLLKDNKDVKELEYRIVSTQIEQILSNPREYEDKEVTVSGTVSTSLSLGIKYYAINDGTGTIYILTDNAVPLEGDLVKVTGKFNQFIKIGDKQYSTITEKKRQKE